MEQSETDLIKELRDRNPYPEDIFKVGKKYIQKAVKCLIDNGFSSEAIHGTWGRIVWNNCCEELKKIVEDKN